jgi:Transmembrane secretion effector
VIVDSFMQTYVSPDIFGRVTSATMAVMFAMMPAGALLAGVLATALGVRAALWIFTALIAASGLTFLLTPMRHLRDLPQRPAEDSPPATHLDVLVRYVMTKCVFPRQWLDMP